MREEEGFDWSVLWSEEEPATFTMPLIIILVVQAITLIVLFIKK